MMILKGYLQQSKSQELTQIIFEPIPRYAVVFYII